MNRYARYFFILLCLPIFVMACSEVSSVFHEPYQVRTDITANGLSVYAYQNEPCGCSAQAVQLDQCVQTTDACMQDCENCLESISIFHDGVEICHKNKEYFTDLEVSCEHHADVGDMIDVHIKGCGRDLAFSIPVVQASAVSATLNHEIIDETHISWDVDEAVQVGVGIGHGYGGYNCLTDDDGEEIFPWRRDPQTMTILSFVKYYMQSTQDIDGVEIENFTVAGLLLQSSY